MAGKWWKIAPLHYNFPPLQLAVMTSLSDFTITFHNPFAMFLFTIPLPHFLSSIFLDCLSCFHRFIITFHYSFHTLLSSSSVTLLFLFTIILQRHHLHHIYTLLNHHPFSSVFRPFSTISFLTLSISPFHHFLASHFTRFTTPLLSSTHYYFSTYCSLSSITTSPSLFTLTRRSRQDAMKSRKVTTAPTSDIN